MVVANGGAAAMNQEELHQCLRIFFPRTANSMHTRVNQNWDLATAMNQELRMLADLVEPKLDWRTMLDAHIRSQMKDDYTFQKISRRTCTVCGSSCLSSAEARYCSPSQRKLFGTASSGSRCGVRSGLVLSAR